MSRVPYTFLSGIHFDGSKVTWSIFLALNFPKDFKTKLFMMGLGSTGGNDPERARPSAVLPEWALELTATALTLCRCPLAFSVCSPSWSPFSTSGLLLARTLLLYLKSMTFLFQRTMTTMTNRSWRSKWGSPELGNGDARSLSSLPVSRRAPGRPSAS